MLLRPNGTKRFKFAANVARTHTHMHREHVLRVLVYSCWDTMRLQVVTFSVIIPMFKFVLGSVLNSRRG